MTIYCDEVDEQVAAEMGAGWAEKVFVLVYLHSIDLAVLFFFSCSHLRVPPKQ